MVLISVSVKSGQIIDNNEMIDIKKKNDRKILNFC